jgi:ubiquinone/menaquinone biosynthesis C-methylase UbiE
MSDDPLAERTAKLQALGKGVLQIFHCDDTEKGHVLHLLNWLNPRHGARILDVGCGVGAVASIMQQARPDLGFTLLNTSAYQLSVCPAHMNKVCADMHNTGLEAVQFDVVMVNYTFGHAEPASALKEFHRLLAPGGELFLYDMEGVNPYIHHVLGYQTYTTADMVTQAARQKFELSAVLYPSGNTDSFEEVLALDPEHTDAIRLSLQGLRPVIWKFTKTI